MFDRLLEIREKYNLSQKDMASIIGVDRSIISKWETSKEVVPLRHLNCYSNYFHVSFDYLSHLSDIPNYDDTKEDLDLEVIGLRIKYLRKHFSLSLRDLAKELNTSSSTISAYETGKVLISTHFAYSIAFKYKVSMDWILGKIDNMEVQPSKTQYAYS